MGADPRATRRALFALGLAAACSTPAPAVTQPATPPIVRAEPRLEPEAAAGSPRRALSTEGTDPLRPASVERLRPRYLAAIARAKLWLDQTEVDPMDLRTRGIKGKKKLVEQLDAYYRLWRRAGEAERKSLLERIRAVVAVVYEDRYHDLLDVPDLQFKQDATSYLRCALLMERLGLDTRRYRQEIARVHPRLNKHMTIRGAYQRRVFHWYYQHFGLKEPFPLEGALAKGLVAKRADPTKFNADDVYALTHEVYALYEYGDRLDAAAYDAEERDYLRTALGLLITRYRTRGNPDLTAELVECARMLKMADMPEYALGIDYILKSQKDDGSWGDYERYRPRHGDFIRQGFVLHTTLVAIGALTLAFDDR